MSRFLKALAFFLLASGGLFLHFGSTAADHTQKDSGTYPVGSLKEPPQAVAEAGTEDTQQNGLKPALLEVLPELVQWKAISDGLDVLQLGLTRATINGNTCISIAAPTPPEDLVIIRADSSLYEFTLHMASEDKQHRSMSENATIHGLIAAINAGMYLPDNLTNTGFMQSSTHTNNPRIASRFGMFFVTGPLVAGLPEAALLEKAEIGDKVAETLANYKIAVQNFRLISSGGEILWPESSNWHSISALAEDKQGRILFIMCRFPLSPADFSRLLLALPLDLGPVMYLEGGSHAGMLLRVPGQEGDSQAVWRGKRNSILTLDGAPDAPLPNIIGIRPIAPKAQAEKPIEGKVED